MTIIADSIAQVFWERRNKDGEIDSLPPALMLRSYTASRRQVFDSDRYFARREIPQTIQSLSPRRMAPHAYRNVESSFQTARL